MVKREYTRDTSLQRTLLIKISLLVAFVLYFAHYNNITIKHLRVPEIYFLLIFFTILILVLVIVEKVIPDKEYMNYNIIIYLLVYLLFLITIFMYFNLIIVNLIYSKAAVTRASKINMYDDIYYTLLVIIVVYIFVLLFIDIFTSKNDNTFQNLNIVNKVVKNKINGNNSMKENTMKLNVFLDTILNFIYLFIILRIFLYLLNKSNKYTSDIAIIT
jgi:hypothetical protein